MPESKGYIPNQDKWMQAAPFTMPAFEFPTNGARTVKEQQNKLLSSEETRIAGMVRLLLLSLPVLALEYIHTPWAVTIAELREAYPAFLSWLDLEEEFLKIGRYGDPVSVFLCSEGIEETVKTSHYAVQIEIAENRNQNIQLCNEIIEGLEIEKDVGDIRSASRAFYIEASRLQRQKLYPQKK